MGQEIITYLEKTKNTEFTVTLVKYLNNQNIQARNSLWVLSSQITMIGEDVDKRNYIVSNAKIESSGFKPKYTLNQGILELIKGYKMLKSYSHGNV